MKIYGINRKIIFGFARKIERKIGTFLFDGMRGMVIKKNCLAGIAGDCANIQSVIYRYRAHTMSTV